MRPKKPRKPVKEKLKNFWFRVRIRPLLRDSYQFIFLRIPRVIHKTPKVGGKRLALKPMPENPKAEIKAREAIMKIHEGKETRTYVLEKSRRYAPILGKRTEIYYDRPSLADLINGRRNRRVRQFLKREGITLEEAQQKAAHAFDELSANVAPLHFSAKEYVELDWGEDQFMADSFDNKGRLKLIMIDM